MLKIAAGTAAIAAAIAFLAGDPLKGALLTATAITVGVWASRQKQGPSR